MVVHGNKKFAVGSYINAVYILINSLIIYKLTGKSCQP